MCEGDSTEPSYFEAIRDEVIKNTSDVEIKISPRYKEDNTEAANPKSGRKKRSLKEVTPKKEAKIHEYEVEPEYKAQPVRYVREAQKGLEDGTFNEVWAVFDKDGHPQQKEAFELACRDPDKEVRIAFTSISFEHWVLLHFEYNDTPFRKSQCKDDGKPINCGTNKHKDDCQGSLCVCGHVTTKGYQVSNCKGGSNMYTELEPYLAHALSNAVKLRDRQHIKSTVPIYEMNPYTNIDKLVVSLLEQPKSLKWIERVQDFRTRDVSISFEKKEGHVYILNVENRTSQMYILNKDDLKLLDHKRVYWSLLSKNEIMQPKQKITLECNLSMDASTSSLYITFFDSTKNQYLIRDL